MADLEKRPFLDILRGQRIQLALADSKFAALLWKSVLRNRALQGQSWPWAESEAQIEKYLTRASDQSVSKEVIYVTEALQLVELELKRLGFNKIVINCSVENYRSIQVALRNGYRREGTLNQDYLENGKFRDSAIFGRIL